MCTFIENESNILKEICEKYQDEAKLATKLRTITYFVCDFTVKGMSKLREELEFYL
jgi:hypothetical protein